MRLFSSVFVRESSEVFDTLPTRWKTEDTEPLSVDEAEVIDKLKKLNVNKSPGPDLIPPRILYELRNEIGYPLMRIFNCSLDTKVLPTDWKTANVSAIFKKASVIRTNSRKPCEYYTAARPNKIQHYTDDLRHYADIYVTNEQSVTVIIFTRYSTPNPMELHEYATYVILPVIAVAVTAASSVLYKPGLPL